MSKAMIITVGTGETVSHGICRSIKQQHPDYIVFLLTQKSKEKTLPLILKDEIMQNRSYDEYVLRDENDIETIRSECQKIIIEKMKGYRPKDIVADYTSGTKVMSAGLVLAALERKIGTLVYVSGKRDENGRVISGTERPIPIEPNMFYADTLFKETVRLFNKCQFDTCLGLTQQARNLYAASDFQNKIVLLEKLAQAYSLWDKFALEKAFNSLKEIREDGLLSNWVIKSRVNSNKQILFQENKNRFCKERIIDLLMNAKRRGEIEKKYDDACARLYRVIECLAQFRINERNLYIKDEKGISDTGNLDILKLSSKLQEKYKKYKHAKDGKIKLPLWTDYELLKDLNDGLGSFRDSLKELLFPRNNSILAHGFNPVSGDTYNRIFAEVEQLIKNTFSTTNIDNLFEEIKFPQIKI
jgi:CRISPR-associated protein (TIGR02710 family)